MSGLLRIKFAKDMMTSAVDVVSPDLAIVESIMLAAGEEGQVQVPSEASFLRLHLPWGKTVILKDPGNLNRLVSWKDVQNTLKSRSLTGETPSVASAEFANEQDDIQQEPRVVRSRRKPKAEPRNVVDLGKHVMAQVAGSAGQGFPGRSVTRGARWKLKPDPVEPPLSMTIEHPLGSQLKLRLPHDLTDIHLYTERSRERETTTFTISLTTSEPSANAILSYLQRGDLYAAQAMTRWVEQAKEMLYYKTTNAYAAAVGAYLLLRLRMFRQLHDWPKNLADMFPFLPDGCVIWAWLLIYQKPADRSEIARYLFMAADRGVPIYSEGLRLLTDGLRLLGPSARPVLERIIQQAGIVVPNSPVSASINAHFDNLTTPIAYRIGIGIKP